MLDYAIVPAGTADAAALARVHVLSWRETYAEVLPAEFLSRMSPEAHARRWGWRLARTDEITLAAEGAEGLVGYASGEWARGAAVEGQAEITTLYVLRRAQGFGVGRRLFEGEARALAARGAKSLIVWALAENRAARGFYEHLGGIPAGGRTEWVGGQGAPSVAYIWADLPAWIAAR